MALSNQHAGIKKTHNWPECKINGKATDVMVSTCIGVIKDIHGLFVFEASSNRAMNSDNALMLPTL